MFPEEALANIVGDVDAFAACWGRAVHHGRASPGVCELLTVAGITEWLTLSARLPAFRVVRRDVSIPVSEYTRTARIGGEEVGGVADPERISQLLGAGATLVLQNLERGMPNLGTLADQLAISLSHPVQINAYLTPPGAAALARHADEHDVIVVQLLGTKHWKIAGESCELAVGDVVYIPRGTSHSAETDRCTSLHLTIGILNVTARKVLQRLIDALPLDEPLPMRFAQMDVETLTAWLAGRTRMVSAALLAADVRSVADDARRDARRSPTARRPLEATIVGPPLDARSRLRRRMPAVVRVDSVTAHIRFGDRTVTFPLAAARALYSIAERDEFRVASLSGMSEQSRLVVTRRLVLEGLLEVVGRTLPDP